jgi:predicted secreted acid phosphatase
MRGTTIQGCRIMVFVDFSNPFLRRFLTDGYVKHHRQQLDGIRAQLPSWIAQANAAEAASGLPRRPLAVVLDIDEVILSNIHMNSFQAEAGEQGPESVDFHACDYYAAPDGRPWPRDDLRLNPLLAGARELLEAIRDHGVAVYLITGRLNAIREETVENFVFVGLAGSGANFVFDEAKMRSPDARTLIMLDEPLPAGASVRPFKEGQRKLIDATHRIVLNVGDQVSDMGLYGDVQVRTAHPFYYTT